MIDAASNTVSATITVNTPTAGVAYTPDGKRLYVTRGFGADIIDTATNTVVGAVSGLPLGNTNIGTGFIGPNIIEAPGGSLSVASDAALTGLGFGQFVNFNGGTLRASAGFSSARTISLLGGGGTFDTNGVNVTLSGQIINSGGLTKTGAGTLTLAGNNTYTGGTAINGGTLAITTDANLGNSSGGITFDGGTLRVGADVTLANTRAVTLNAGGGTIDTVNFTTTISQGITGAGGLTKQGVGALVLAGVNNYTGGTTISAGTLQLGTALTAGALVGSVANAGVFNIVNADTSGITSIANTASGLGTQFRGSSSAGTMTITNSNGGGALFQNNSTAGTSTITSSGSNSRTVFSDNSTAANATVITNSGAIALITAAASGGQARFVTNAGGSFDISLLTAGGTTTGSIEGAGTYSLGSKQLTVGSNTSRPR